HGFHGSRDCVLRVEIGALGFLALHCLERIERFHFARKAHRKGGRVELCNVRRPRHSSLQGAPSRRHVVSEWRYRTKTSDDDPTPHYALTLLFRYPMASPT